MRGIVLVTCAVLATSQKTWTPDLARDPAEAPSAGSLCLLQDAKAAIRQGRTGLATEVEANPEVVPVTCEDQDLVAFSASLRNKYFWANKNGDAACTGASTATSPFSVSAGPAWSFKDENASLVRAQPCIDDEMNIYLAHINGKVRKFTPEGKLLWTNHVFNTSGGLLGQLVDDQIPTGPVLMDGVIYVSTTHGLVVGIDMASGETLWQTKAADQSGGDTASVMARSGIVVVAMGPSAGGFGGNRQLVALSGSDGRVLWRWTVPDGQYVYNFIGSFVDGPPSIVFSTAQGRPYRVQLCDGSTLWEGPQIDGNPAMSTGGLIVGPNGVAYGTSNFENATGEFGLLSAFNVSSGEVLWRQPQAMPANNAPSIGKLGSDGQLSVVIAIGKNAGLPDPISEASGHFPDGRPVSWATELLAVDPATGEPTGWRWAPPPHRRPQAEGDYFPDHICLPDAWSNGAIDGSGTFFIGHMSGNIFAVRDANGNGLVDEDAGEVAKFYGGRCYQGSPGLAPGMLVTTPCDGMHVFKSS